MIFQGNSSIVADHAQSLIEFSFRFINSMSVKLRQNNTSGAERSVRGQPYVTLCGDISEEAPTPDRVDACE